MEPSDENLTGGEEGQPAEDEPIPTPDRNDERNETNGGEQNSDEGNASKEIELNTSSSTSGGYGLGGNGIAVSSYDVKHRKIMTNKASIGGGYHLPSSLDVRYGNNHSLGASYGNDHSIGATYDIDHSVGGQLAPSEGGLQVQHSSGDAARYYIKELPPSNHHPRTEAVTVGRPEEYIHLTTLLETWAWNSYRKHHLIPRRRETRAVRRLAKGTCWANPFCCCNPNCNHDCCGEVHGGRLRYKNKSNRANYQISVDMSDLRMVVDPNAKYSNLQIKPNKPYILYKTFFRNDTKRLALHEFKPEEETVSECLLNTRRGFDDPLFQDFRLATPEQIKGNFKNTLEFPSSNSVSTSEPLTVNVENVFVVPGLHETELMLVVEEMEYSWDCVYVSRLTGNVMSSVKYIGCDCFEPWGQSVTIGDVFLRNSGKFESMIKNVKLKKTAMERHTKVPDEHLTTRCCNHLKFWKEDSGLADVKQLGKERVVTIL